MQFENVLGRLGPASALLWGLLLAIPALVVLLYFLKLRRTPLEVPSTFLWARAIEDLHVNSIWQRLRRNLLLFLQLLLLALALLALLNPNWRGSQLIGDRFIFAIDNSASMSAVDVSPSRLEQAKQHVLGLIDAMQSGDEAMVMSFNDSVQILEPLTQNRDALRRAVAAVQPSHRSTNFSEALRVASGLANPLSTSDPDNPDDVQVAEAVPATLYICSDGNFAMTSHFVGKYLTPVYVPFGESDAANRAITEFSVRRNEEKPDVMQAFGLIENFGPEAATVHVELYLGDALGDVKQTTISAGESAGVIFQVENFESGTMRLRIVEDDVLPLDNEAWTAVFSERRSKVLLVTPGNPPLEFALAARDDRIDLEIEEPSYLRTQHYRRHADGGTFDLVIYDRCLPANEADSDQTPTPLPMANTWFIGRAPKDARWGWTPERPWPPERAAVPLIIDVDRAHAVMQYLELGNVRIAESLTLKPPPGGRTLIDSDAGSLLGIATREGFEDLILGFEIFDDEGIATDWPVRASFPVFVLNVLQYLGGEREPAVQTAARPGRPLELKVDSPSSRITVRGPQGSAHEVGAARPGHYTFTHAEQLGLYEIQDAGQTVRHFAVNLFDPQESRLATQAAVQLTRGEPVSGTRSQEVVTRELWKWLLLGALLVLVVEWYIFNRRVYL